jgi:hypothetical protein
LIWIRHREELLQCSGPRSGSELYDLGKEIAVGANLRRKLRAPPCFQPLDAQAGSVAGEADIARICESTTVPQADGGNCVCTNSFKHTLHVLGARV